MGHPVLSKSFTILSSSPPEVPFFFFCFLLALAAVTLRLLLPESAIASKLRQIEGIVCRAASAPDLHGYTEKLIKGHWINKEEPPGGRGSGG